MKSKLTFPAPRTASAPLLLFMTLGAASFVGAAPATAPLEANIVFPANAGILNVRDEKYGAKGDGQADDTAAIQKALTEGLASHHVVYLPNGIYKVSDTLRWQNAANASNNVQGWGPFLQMQGQSRSKTIIRLAEGAAGFNDEEQPKAVVQTGSSGSHGGKTYTNGEGNEAFENHLRDFTVETGASNTGAVGIDWQASNAGGLRHISVKGNGYAGIALTRRDNGPALIKDVSIEGFRFGLRTFQEIAHFTLEDIDLKGQTEAGLWMRDSIVAARHIRSQNNVPAIQMAGNSLLALFDSQLNGQGAAAIACQGTEPRLYVRGLTTSGYAGSVKRRGETQKAVLTEWNSDQPAGNAGGKLSLGLPIKETPDWYDPDPKNWADAGAPSGSDDTKAVQAALNAGKSTVFISYGRRLISDTLVVPAGVKRIFGAGAELTAQGNWPAGKPLFLFKGGKNDLTIFDRLALGGSLGDNPLFEHDDARTLVLRDLICFAGTAYRNSVGAGPLFVEDVVCGGWVFAPGTQAWMRQWNIEGHNQPIVSNDGATIWALGWKTEGDSTVLENKNGGRAEMWAGLSYSFGVSRDRPALVNTDASLTAQMAGMTYVGAGGYFDLLVKDTQKGQTNELRCAQVPGRGNASTFSYVGLSEAKPLVATAPLAVTTDNTKNMNLKKLAVVTALATAPAIVTPLVTTQAVAQTTPKIYKAPDFFDGEENGKPTGNPLEVGGKTTWTAVQVWPDDIFTHDNYKPMNWAGDTWRGAYEYGGQPGVKVAGGTITLTSRGGWGGGGSEGGNKRAALIFTAPASGSYKITGNARSFIWEGDKVAGGNLTFLKYDPTTNKITRVLQVATPNETVVPIEETTVDLQAGQELIFLNAVNSMYNAMALDISGFKMEFTPGLGAAESASTSMKVGATVDVGGKNYKILKVEGKVITLEQQ